MNTSFLSYSEPLITAMIQCETPNECIEKIDKSLNGGAEAFGIQLCQLKKEYRTEENLKEIFSYCNGKPIYITSYRNGYSIGMTDEECADLLLLGARCGATLCDVMGDMFDANDCQITCDGVAVNKQKELVEKIHLLGSDVLISTHDFRNLSGEEILKIAKLQSEHGADILKIVVESDDPKMLSEYINMMQKVKKQIGKPILFLDKGGCANLLRKVGGFLGSCMYLCVESHGPLDTPYQPLLNKIKLIRDNMLEV